MKGYVFIANSTKPSIEQAKSRALVRPGNVSRPCLEAALKLGYDVFLGINRDNPEYLECELPVNLFDSHTYRSITAFLDNIVAYKNLENIIKQNDIEVIHCNTPVGGIIGRICGKKHRIKKIIYTAHGFHFYKGAPLINRTLFKCAEKVMARWTDVIITMNQEDYESAKCFKLKKGGKVYKVHGVGINLFEYSNLNVNIQQKREEVGLSDSNLICISVGDLIKRKNFETAIKSISKLNNTNVHLVICGSGPYEDKLKEIAKEFNVESQVHFLGFRNDIKELLIASDIFLFPTLQEGLPRALMESMAAGLPAITSKIRGNIDLIEDKEGGFLCNPLDVEAYAQSIESLLNNPSLRRKMGEYNKKRIKKYDIEYVKNEIKVIYDEVLNDEKNITNKI